MTYPPMSPPPYQPGSPGQPGLPGLPAQFGGVGRPPRPWPVTLAAGLMFLYVVLSLVGGIVALSTRSYLEDSLRDQLRQQGTAIDENTLQTILTVAFVMSFVLALVVALITVSLAAFLLRGSNVARIITWVFAGLSLCFSGFGGVSSLTGSFGGLSTVTFPTWYTVYQVSLSIVSVLLFLAVIVLLLLPSSNTFFAPRRPAAY